MDSLFDEYNTEPIKEALKLGDLLSRIKRPEKKEKKKRGITNERQAITNEIVEIMEKESDRPVNIKLLVIKLSHVPVEDLYFMKKRGLEYRSKKGEPFGKYIWGSIKVRIDK